ncbi:MAG TPA: hypothetical protein DDZ81_04630 [Acetobacteraceae bacterium]|jgi:hypothetical protein|nr:hypothetical protein [Acetobacteraceae bacterium]
MFLTRALRFSGFALFSGALVLASAISARAQLAAPAGPMEITTDTPEYCQELLLRVGNLVRLATAPVPREVTDLTSEGQRMCDHGQTRGGIMRVRSALMMLEKGGGTAYR